MIVSVSNIVFVQDKPRPGKDRLVAVFDVNLPLATVTIHGFRYLAPEVGSEYVLPPSIKTNRGFVYPISASLDFKNAVYTAFIEAWKALPKPPTTVPA